MNLYHVPAMAREKLPHWFDVVKVTSHDGRTTNSRSIRNAAIALYGSAIMSGNLTREERKFDDGTFTNRRQSYYCLKTFNRTGETKECGAVYWYEPPYWQK